MKTLEQELFDLCEINEGLDGKIHVIDQTSEYEKEEKQYRVYHKDGYCFDTRKVISDRDEDSGEPIFEYQFYSEWDEFKTLTVKQAIKLFN